MIDKEPLLVVSCMETDTYSEVSRNALGLYIVPTDIYSNRLLSKP